MNTFKFLAVLLTVTLLGKSALAQGAYGGSKEHPMTAAFGEVQKIVARGTPLKLEATKIEVKFSGIYYEAVAESGRLCRPTSGEAQTVVIGDFKVELASKDFSKGFLDTKDFGKIALFVIPNMTGPDSWIMAVTDEQLKKIQPKIKKKEVE